MDYHARMSDVPTSVSRPSAKKSKSNDDGLINDWETNIGINEHGTIELSSACRNTTGSCAPSAMSMDVPDISK